MNVLAAVQNHGYAATAVLLFLSACGLPLPLSVVLLTAGAAAHSGSLNLALVILCAAGAALARRHDPLPGRQVHRMVAARRALPPQPQPRDLHLRLGPILLSSRPAHAPLREVHPRPGTVAAPLAGSLNMRLTRFLKLDMCGVLFYTAAWSTVGFLCAPFLRILISWVKRVGHFTAATVSAPSCFIWSGCSAVLCTKTASARSNESPQKSSMNA